MEALEEALKKIEKSAYVDKCALFKPNGEPIVSHVDEEITRLVKPFFGLDTTVERTILEKRWSRIIVGRLRDYVFVLSSRRAPNLGLLNLEFNKALNLLKEILEGKSAPLEKHEKVTISRVRIKEKEEEAAWEALIDSEKRSEINHSLITSKTIFNKNSTLEEFLESPKLEDLKSLNDWVLIFSCLLMGKRH
ncbi:MAG: hypothetical protein ACUVXA_02240 [Candidatus Jordarchaeum sp.]|uniref:hypothetical protein n=1 Tax=Candidatus Jordarchaeum sp. TaxID=2823881 RepID=UPI004049DFB0